MDKEINIFVGCYNQNSTAGIFNLLLDLDTGKITNTNKEYILRNPSWLEVDPKHRVLFAIEEINGQDDGKLVKYTIDNSELTKLGEVSVKGTDSCHFSFYNNLGVVSSYSGESITLVDIKSMTILDSVVFTGSGPNKERQEKPHPHCSIFSPGGEFIFTTDLGADSIYTFKVENNRLILKNTTITAKGSGPRHICFVDNNLFLVNELDSTLSNYHMDQKTGTLDHIRTITTRTDNSGENYPSGIIYIKEYELIIVANRGNDNIVFFDVSNGKMLLVSSFPSGGNWPRHIIVSPNKKYLLVANQFENNLSVIKLDQRGYPTKEIDKISIKSPAGLAL